MPRITHFEIHVSNPERAVEFYKKSFGWEINKWKSNDMDYWLVMTGKEGSNIQGKENQGIDGGLIIRKGPEPEENQPVNAYVCTMEVDNVDDYIKKVEENGGKIAVPKMVVPGVGWLVYCKDTERNLFGMMEGDPDAK